MLRKPFELLLCLAMSFYTHAAHAEDAKLKYPDTRRVDQADDFHGVKGPRSVSLARRRRPRRRKRSPTGSTAENKVARAYLDAIPELPVIRNTLADMWNYERYSAPWQEAGKYFYSKNDGLQNQSVLYVADTLPGRRSRADRPQQVVERRHDRAGGNRSSPTMASSSPTRAQKRAAIGRTSRHRSRHRQRTSRRAEVVPPRQHRVERGGRRFLSTPAIRNRRRTRFPSRSR